MVHPLRCSMTHVHLHAAQNTSRYLILVLASTFLQGSSFVASKILLDDVQPLWLAAMRFLVAALSLAPILIPKWVRRPPGDTTAMPWWRLAVIGLFQTAGVMAFLNLGLQQTTAPKAAILMASNPLLVALLAGVLLNERVRAMAWIGLGLAFIGVIICIGVAAVTNGSIGQGDVLVMAGSACWAVATLVTKRFNLSVDTLVLSFWQMLIGAVALAVLALMRGDAFTLPGSSGAWIAFLWLAIPASTGAMGLWFAALRVGGAVHTSGFLFLCPLFAALIAFAMTGEMLSRNEIGGGVLIAGGIYLVSRQAKGLVARSSENRRETR